MQRTELNFALQNVFPVISFKEVSGLDIKFELNGRQCITERTAFDHWLINSGRLETVKTERTQNLSDYWEMPPQDLKIAVEQDLVFFLDLLNPFAALSNNLPQFTEALKSVIEHGTKR